MSIIETKLQNRRQVPICAVPHDRGHGVKVMGTFKNVTGALSQIIVPPLIFKTHPAPMRVHCIDRLTET